MFDDEMERLVWRGLHDDSDFDFVKLINGISAAHYKSI